MTDQTDGIFLDHNAGTPVDSRVLDRFLEVERLCPANPGGLHGPGRRARAALEEARSEAAEALGVTADEVLFVSGATEANNLVVAGVGDPDLPVLCGDVEHASIAGPARRRGRIDLELDHEARLLPVLPAALEGTPVGLLCAVHAQSEVGTVQPIGELADLARSLEIPFHVDAAQSIGRLPLDEVLELADSVSFSTHKAGGMRGGSMLLLRSERVRPRPLIVGGAQERGLRPGTTSPSLAAATARAVHLAVEERETRSREMREARDHFVGVLNDRSPGRLLTPLEDSLPNTAMWWFPVPDGRSLLMGLDLCGVHASQGSACTTGSPEPPAVLGALGLDAADARRCVRFSFGVGQDPATAEDAAQRVAEVVARTATETV